MISFNLKCENNHKFEGWFKGNANFNDQQNAGQVECPICSSNAISKALSAPNISTSRKQEAAQAELATQTQIAIKQIRDTVKSSCDDVGKNFAEEARKIHYGERQERGIYGKATADESKDLAEEGIKFLPLPWMEEEKSN